MAGGDRVTGLQRAQGLFEQALKYHRGMLAIRDDAARFAPESISAQWAVLTRRVGMPHMGAVGRSPFTGNQAFHLNYFQIPCSDPLQLPERIRVPALVMGATDKEVTAVVGEEHSIFLQGHKNNSDFRTEARKVVIGFQPYAHAHGRQISSSASLAQWLAGGT